MIWLIVAGIVFILGGTLYYLSARYDLEGKKAGPFWLVLLDVGFLGTGFGSLKMGIQTVLSSAYSEVPSGVIDIFSFALGVMGLIVMFVSANIVQARGEIERKKT